MNKEILNKAKSILAQRALQAESAAQQSKEKAMQEAEFKSLYQDYVCALIDFSKGKTTNPAALQKKCDAWLKKHGFAPIIPQYSCPKCQDSGYVDGQMCDCLKREITKILISQSGFKNLQRFENAKFDMFDNPKQIKLLYSKMQEWCNQPHPTKTLIFLSGDTGVGKTHLTECMANALIQKSKVVNFTSAFSMNQDFIRAYTGFDSERREQTLQKYLDCQYLFIDDLGTELKQKGITVNLLYLLLQERKLRSLCTVITSNLDIKELRDFYDERIASRILDKDTSICIRLDGRDLRIKSV